MPPPRFFLVALSALVLVKATGWAGSAPDGFAGVPWKSTPLEARLIMLGREGLRIKEETPERMVLTGGTFMDHPVERWELEFTLGNFQRGTAYVTVPTGTAKDGRPMGDHQFDDYYHALSAKYGKSTSPGNPGEAQYIWKWTLPDPHTGDRIVRSILLSYKWGSPPVFKVQYANEAPEVSKPENSRAPVNTSDL